MPATKWAELPREDVERRRINAQQGRERYQAWRSERDEDHALTLARLAQTSNMAPLTGPLDYTTREIRTPSGLQVQRVPKWPGGPWNGMPVPAGVYATVDDLDAFHQEWVRSGKTRSWVELPRLIRKRKHRLAQRRARERGQHPPRQEPRRSCPPGMTTAIYRHFDADDVLLYVGITDDLARRGSRHSKRSSWSSFAVRSVVVWYSHRGDAELAEVVAIKAEEPLFNDQHATSEARAKLVLYLVEKGRLDLLAPAVSRG